MARYKRTNFTLVEPYVYSFIRQRGQFLTVSVEMSPDNAQNLACLQGTTA